MKDLNIKNWSEDRINRFLDDKVKNAESVSIPTEQETSVARGVFLHSFNCKNCGTCCTDESLLREPLTSQDAQRIARHLHIKTSDFRDKYLLDGSLPAMCPFHGKNGCEIYSVRPEACRMFPVAEYEEGCLTLRVECTRARLWAIHLMKIIQKRLKEELPSNAEGIIAQGQKPVKSFFQRFRRNH